MKFSKAILLVFVMSSATILAQNEKVNPEMIQRIRKEGLENSKVMEIAFRLTDANGPRLTGSPGFIKAADYAKNTLAQWGLTNSMLDPWGVFGKSWELKKSYIAITAPWYRSLSAYPKTWTRGIGGAKSAEVILIMAKDSAGLDAYRGKLSGKILLTDKSDTYKFSFKPDASRYTKEKLDSMSEAKITPEDTAARRRRREQMTAENRVQQALMTTLKTMAISEGALAILSTNIRNHDGTVFVQQAGPYKMSDPANFLDIALQWEDYMSMVRLLKNNIPVKMDMDVETKFYTADTLGYNVIAEITGTGKSNEVVMLGAHLDSWHGATGATDNAAGCAVMMEAVRILKAIGMKPERTIRIALWGGEEQGLLGSRGYVKKNFADPADMKLLPAHEKLSAYFNLDNGAGKIRGIYLQGNEAVTAIFRQWIEPFNDLGAQTLSISNTGSTDHIPFDAVGLPAFQFIQDPLEYGTRTHHSNMDLYDHLPEEDLKQAATVVAGFIYNAAMWSSKLPRKELPKPSAGSAGR